MHLLKGELNTIRGIRVRSCGISDRYYKTLLKISTGNLKVGVRRGASASCRISRSAGATPLSGPASILWPLYDYGAGSGSDLEPAAMMASASQRLLSIADYDRPLDVLPEPPSTLLFDLSRTSCALKFATLSRVPVSSLTVKSTRVGALGLIKVASRPAAPRPPAVVKWIPGPDWGPGGGAEFRLEKDEVPPPTPADFGIN
ncbi:hypothetical protein EVAR_97533_1 [Eumeta japonica]|uniref:Uncharacterized protein n=1 Tax=Eumeta variegata TaxID=151549 RepID=A0A4C1WM15_EUMVA|nr:hypothetical protein EVAR_97533_1 [Eumeta japonica]